jgi:hypothetical protein
MMSKCWIRQHLIKTVYYSSNISIFARDQGHSALYFIIYKSLSNFSSARVE